jgi:hypothetical protein
VEAAVAADGQVGAVAVMAAAGAATEVAVVGAGAVAGVVVIAVTAAEIVVTEAIAGSGPRLILAFFLSCKYREQFSPSHSYQYLCPEASIN